MPGLESFIVCLGLWLKSSICTKSGGFPLMLNAPMMNVIIPAAAPFALLGDSDTQQSDDHAFGVKLQNTVLYVIQKSKTDWI